MSWRHIKKKQAKVPQQKTNYIIIAVIDEASVFYSRSLYSVASYNSTSTLKMNTRTKRVCIALIIAKISIHLNEVFSTSLTELIFKCFLR